MRAPLFFPGGVTAEKRLLITSLVSGGRQTLPAAGEIHLWKMELGEVSQCRERAFFRGMLSTEESIAAERYHFERDRWRYVGGRGALRCLLASYTGSLPSEIRFSYGALGKPVLENALVPEFNLSHSGDLVLIAVATLLVGVDVERIRQVQEMEAIARRFFVSSEVDLLLSVSDPDQRCRLFFRCWTRKEAVIKALGRSIADIGDVDVLPDGGVDAGSEVPVCVVLPDGVALQVFNVEVGEGYMAACASPYAAPQVSLRESAFVMTS